MFLATNSKTGYVPKLPAKAKRSTTPGQFRLITATGLQLPVGRLKYNETETPLERETSEPLKGAHVRHCYRPSSPEQDSVVITMGSGKSRRQVRRPVHEGKNHKKVPMQAMNIANETHAPLVQDNQLGPFLYHACAMYHDGMRSLGGKST